MAFGSFTNIAQVQTAYQIRYQLQATVLQPQAYQPSESFTQNFITLSSLINVFAKEDNFTKE